MKIAVLIFLLVGMVGWGVYRYLTADTAATHMSLKAARLPPLIPINAFFADTKSRWSNQVSFDGTYLADLGTEWGKYVVNIRRADNPSAVLSTIKMSNIQRFSWDSQKNSVLVYSDYRLWEIDAEQPEPANRKDVTPRGFDRWTVKFTPSEPHDDPRKNRWVVASNDRNPEANDLYSVRSDGGGKELLARNNGNTIDWHLDRHGTPAIRMDRNSEGGTDIYLLGNSGDDRLFKSIDVRDSFLFVGRYDEKSPLLAISNVDRDKLVLVEVNTNDGSEKVLDRHDRVDLSNYWRFEHTSSSVDLVRYFDGYPELRAFSQRGEVAKRLIESLGEHVHVDYISSSAAGRFLTAEISVDQKAYQVFLLDLEKETINGIHEANFRRYKDSLTATKPVYFNASDGVEIPGFLTLPVGTEAKNLPAIVRIHGGPASYVALRYDHLDQFLANRGYAVLNVNFRGSTGYGKAYRALGYGNFGTSMQSDITDAANWLIEQGIADGNKLAVFGPSYGGYSAALAMTRDAGTFAAGVVEMAVTDVVYQMDNNPYAWGLHLDEMKRYFGDPENQDDRQLMKERSPIAHVQNAQGPILLIHGKRDRIVGFEQSEEFERALAKAGKQVSAHYPEKMAHGYHRWQDRVTRARLLEDFLAEHLGGRSGGRDWAELAAKYF